MVDTDSSLGLEFSCFISSSVGERDFMKKEKIEITKDQAEALKDLIDIWFFREVRENEDIDNTMWAWNILDIYKQCQEIIDGYNTKAQLKSESKTETNDDFIVNELLEVHFKTKT